MNVIRKTSNISENEPRELIDLSSFSEPQRQTYKILSFIEEVTGKQVLEYQKTIGNILEPIANDKILEQQDYFRFTTGYLLRENIQTDLKYNDYETYVLEKNKELRRKEDQENKLQLGKSINKAQVLYEALAPIHNRLMRIKLFFDNLARYDKLTQQTRFNMVYNQKIELVDEMSKQLISDKGDITKLEEDAKFMRAQEKIIINTAKESYKLYMLQIYRKSPDTKALFNQGSSQGLIYSDYKTLQNQFDEKVNNSEDFWEFHEKFFSVLVRLGLREDRRKKKR